MNILQSLQQRLSPNGSTRSPSTANTATSERKRMVPPSRQDRNRA